MSEGPGGHILRKREALEQSNQRLRDALVHAGFRLSDSETENARLRKLLSDLGVDKSVVSGDNKAPT